MQSQFNYLPPSERAISLGDKVQVVPVYGRLRRFEISRTRMLIESENFTSENGNDLVVKKTIPTYINQNFQLVITKTQALEANGVSQARFSIESTNGRPFLFKGNLVYKMLLSHGDQIEIGMNKISFAKKDVKCCDSDDLIIKHVLKDYDSKLCRQLFKSRLPLLLEGETGTGKTFLARTIHERSGCSGRFVHINLSAYSESILESELFGHTKGAFTGAINDRLGAIAHAEKGTLFLDEIDSVSREIQTKLLLFLDSYMVTPVGSNVARKVNCRVIAASGKQIIECVNNGQMRRDFYHRISMGQVFSLKPLRENKALIENFILNFEARNQIYLAKNLREFYRDQPWPGNFRQLEGHMRKKLALLNHSDRMEWDDVDNDLLADTPKLIQKQQSSKHQWDGLAKVKKDYCIFILKKYHGDINLAAKVLGVSTKTLKRFLKVKENAA